MNTLKNILVVALISVSVIACKNDAKPEVKTIETEVASEINTNEAKQLDPNATYAKAEFGIEGMTCAMGCAKTIEKKIAKMDGVKSAKVDFEKEIAMVEYDEAKVTTNSLEEAVAKAGGTYKVKDMKTVKSFSSEKHECSGKCDKASCANKTKAEKMACAKDCKEACCAKKA
ncbi:heavy-metal-associated domain-containing protein [Psychroserpens ponticola]|uniref:Heavy metal-associated domain-containing protein n=1 Tax=Psychroserpens ponticola TaxID=2932268 RepID=A0ABY7RYP9_9FLAO|nr:heavy metal-associated domain-containing protein [Psychroserpens ponticola]WCO01820.1 heavy metal-associated domain-containing protein [Psychroserpens ponticola]